MFNIHNIRTITCDMYVMVHHVQCIDVLYSVYTCIILIVYCMYMYMYMYMHTCTVYIVHTLHLCIHVYIQCILFCTCTCTHVCAGSEVLSDECEGQLH